LNTLRFSLLVKAGQPELYYRNKRLSHYDAVIPRIGASITMFGTAVVRQLEQMGVFALNSSQAIGVSRDKLRSIQLLSRHEVGIPPTAFARDRDSVLPAIEQVGGAPVVIKLIEGAQGIGVMLAETTKIAEAIIEALQSARQNVVVQKFVDESRGRDLRVLVVGDRVVAAMSRQAALDDFRANIHRGGKAEAVKLEPAYELTAIRAAQVLGLRVAGVDMLESDAGPQLLEVNSSPGLADRVSRSRSQTAAHPQDRFRRGRVRDRARHGAVGAHPSRFQAARSRDPGLERDPQRRRRAQSSRRAPALARRYAALLR
jgi:ribosomal protein S6--L-glutamate ligase